MSFSLQILIKLICVRNINQIATLDLDSGRILWAWGEGVLDWPHHPTMLPNGNTLICDGENGRSLEVTADGDKVGVLPSSH